MQTDNTPQARRKLVETSLAALNACMEGTVLEEPLATQFASLKAQYNAVLEGMPMTDAVPAAQQAAWALERLQMCMLSTQSVLSAMSVRLADMHKTVQLAKTTEADAAAALADKVKKGELVDKATVTTLCAEAREKGILDGQAAATEEVKKKETRLALIGDRRKAVLAANLPAPDAEDLLAGTDDEFKAAQAKAQARYDKLRAKGVRPASALMAKVWLADGEFQTIEMLVEETLKGGTEPITPAAGDDGKPRRTSVPL